MPDLKVVELFCGIGGFHAAFEKAKNDLKGAPTEIEYKVRVSKEFLSGLKLEQIGTLLLKKNKNNM